MFKAFFERSKAKKEAERLFYSFRYAGTAGTMEIMFQIATEMESHFSDCWGKEPSDLVGAALLDIMLPKKNVNRKDVLDLTGGRPDTPEWIAFLLIVDRSNPYYDEYFGGLDSMHDYGHDVRWIVPILKHLLPSFEGYNYERCQRTIANIQ